jgi:hypothetical protein
VNQDAEVDSFVLELPAEIAGLLGDPGGSAWSPWLVVNASSKARSSE